MTTMLQALLRALPRFTALTMAASMVSTSLAVSYGADVGWTGSDLVVADLLVAVFAGLFAAGPLALDCCADRLLTAGPSRTNSKVKMGSFFMDEGFFIRSTANEAVTFPCAGIILIKCAGIISALCGRHPE